MRPSIYVLAIIGLLTGISSHAALTGSITISGTVPGATAIVVNSAAGYNTLDLSASATDQLVANVREINNTAEGYTVALASTNAGQFKNGSIGSIAYTAKYNAATVTLSATPQVVSTVGASTGIVNVVKPLTISYTGQMPESMMQGTYSDTLTFTIAAN